MSHIHLLLLPGDDTMSPTLLSLAEDGRILARGLRPAATNASVALAVPGEDCRVLRMRLPARSLLQARAAARLMLREQLVDDAETLHVAVGPPMADAHRLVVVVSTERMRHWLGRAHALGFQAGAMIPTPLLLGHPAGNAVRTADHGGLRLACAEDLCFAAEPELADQLLAGRTIEHVDDAETALARCAVAPVIDLLQGAFAPVPERREGWPAWRRAALLAGILLLSPLLLLATEALRDHFAARRAESQASVLARTVLPALPAGADPQAAVRAQLEALRGADRFVHATGTLFDAISGIAGAELDRLSWADGTLRATLVLARQGDMERLRTALAGNGLDLLEEPGDDGSDRGRYRIDVRPLP